MRDVKTNEFLNSHSRIQVIEVYVDDSRAKKMRVIGTDLSLDSKFITISDMLAAYSYMLNFISIITVYGSN